MRKILIIIAAITAVFVASVMLAASVPASSSPVILLVSQQQAIQLMTQHFWCTRLRPEVFECTPVAPSLGAGFRP